jgi:hypothetical protein
MLRQIGPEIWLSDGPAVSFYGFAYPTHMVVIRLSDGNLIVWSPIPASAELREEIDRLGRVAHLVSPNYLHHLWLREWTICYPRARLYAPLKFLATAFSSVSGIPGGIFSPSLSIGAGIGSDIAHFFHHAAPGPIVLLGMVAYFTGVVRAPITGFVIVSEMTGDHGMLVPLMATALLANAVARLLNKEGVYHLLAKRF